MVEFKFVLLAAVGIHQILKRREPTVLQFLVLVSLLNIALFAESYSGSSQSSSPFIHLVRTFKHAFLTTSTFLFGLAGVTIVYRLSPSHPLASYPGPVLAKVSKWWMAYWIGKGERHLVLQRLHEKYGPWLRIGPNELSINLFSAVRPVYSQMFRAPAYRGAPQDADALITTTSREEHASRLVAWIKAFTPESLRNFRSITQTRTEQLLDILQRECRSSSESNGKKSVDLSHWVSLWSMDVMGDMSFSGGFETMAAGKDTEGWMEVLQMGVLFVGILGQVPWLRDTIALLPRPGPIITFQQFAGRKVRETKTLAGGAVKQDILGIIQDPSSGGPVLSTAQAAADASLIVVAGSDTVSQGSTALLRYVIGDKDVQQRIRQELEREFAGEELDAGRLARLEYLDACVQEGLRIVPPVAAGPPRYADRSMHVLGRYIPKATTVACPIWSMQHDPANFAHPDLFLPDRWLSSESTHKAVSPHKPEAFVPFCYGPGVCIGKPVALHNMKYLVAKLLTSFELEFADGFDVERFDRSWKEHNLWLHDPLLVKMKSL